MQRNNSPRRVLLRAVAMAATAISSLAHAQPDVPYDPLSLQSAPVEKVETENSSSSTKIFIEGSLVNASQRYQPGSVDSQRASFDLSYSGRAGTGLRAVFSDRIDSIHPAALGNDATVNSLREAYLSWQPNGGNTIVDFGRINWRTGPGYGYNPTDFFRDNSLRVVTSADPLALRQNRMGSVMLRAQQLWADGSLSFAYSPKLATSPSANGWSLDLGATNNRDRGVIMLGTKFSERVSSQLLVYKEGGLSSALGANLTALLSDAATAHLEWTRSSEPDVLSRALSLGSTSSTRNRFVGGVTYTTLGKTSITAEYEYNGFGLNQAGWDALGVAQGRQGQLAYLSGALGLQELAPKQVYLIYVTQKGLWSKDLDLTAYLRFDTADNSKLAWLELRRHWPKFDLTFQLQQNIGKLGSELGILPDRRVMQILGTYYF